MKIIEESIEGGVKITLQGELTTQTSSDLEVVLKKIVDSKINQITIDMRKIEYIDSSGLRLLVDYHHQVAYLQGAFVLFAPTANVRKVIEVTHLDQVLTIKDESKSSD